MRQRRILELSECAAAIYSCWSCGEEFEVTECDGLTADLEIACPACGGDLVGADFGLSRRPASRQRSVTQAPARRSYRTVT